MVNYNLGFVIGTIQKILTKINVTFGKLSKIFL